MKVNKKVYYSFKLLSGVFLIALLMQIVPKFMDALGLLGKLFQLTDTSPEFKIILVCISIYVNIAVISIIFTGIGKLNEIIKIEEVKNGTKK